jgi:hypothetical protein
VRRDDAAHPHLLSSEFLTACGNDRHERGKRSQRTGEDAFELQHAAFVEHDGVEFLRVEASVVEAPLNRG